jgi:hypothetical protein
LPQYRHNKYSGTPEFGLQAVHFEASFILQEQGQEAIAMFTNDRTSVERLRAQRTLFSLWMAVAAFLVIVTMAAGIATSANAAAQAVDTLHTSAIPQVATTSQAGPHILLIILSAAAFIGLGIGGLTLTRRSLKDEARRFK